MYVSWTIVCNIFCYKIILKVFICFTSFRLEENAFLSLYSLKMIMVFCVFCCQPKTYFFCYIHAQIHPYYTHSKKNDNDNPNDNMLWCLWGVARRAGRDLQEKWVITHRKNDTSQLIVDDVSLWKTSSFSLPFNQFPPLSLEIMMMTMKMIIIIITSRIFTTTGHTQDMTHSS